MAVHFDLTSSMVISLKWLATLAPICTSFSRNVMRDQSSTFLGSANVRFWLGAEVSTNADEGLLSGGKQTFRASMSVLRRIADEFQGRLLFPVLTDTVNKLFSSPVSATLIRPTTQPGNNDSRARQYRFNYCSGDFPPGVYQQYRPKAEIYWIMHFSRWASKIMPIAPRIFSARIANRRHRGTRP